MASFSPFPPLKTNYTALLDVTQSQLGFDPSILINVGLILAAVSTALVYVGRATYTYASNIILSSVHINEDDPLYEGVMRYISDKHTSSKRFRSVQATTKAQSSWSEEETIAKKAGKDFNIKKLISYRALVSRTPILMTPFQSKHFFFHKGNFLYFRHSTVKNAILSLSNQHERGYITLQCLGRSLEPLQKFLEETQLYNLQKSMATTAIHRALNNMRDQLRWHAVLSRPERDIRTVILDREKKQALLADINEYLHPATRRWYANHGIPYRRGYLFSGAPGTGKTSLTAALAGVFGLNIYVLSLLDPALTESQLNRLLSEVPNRCIVLLEDVDAAGLTRPGELNKNSNKTASKTQSRPGAGKGEQEVAKEVIGELKLKPATEISLSGLLNAIDGVSSHEGRILVMTTNAPEELDKALIRPGRVDMHIAFQLPKYDEMRQLFLSMYRDSDFDLPSKVEENQDPEKSKLKQQDKQTSTTTDEKRGGDDDKDTQLEIEEFEASEGVHEMARTFAAALPEGKLSLAAIQGFLLRYKRDPQKAVEGATAWAEETLAKED